MTSDSDSEDKASAPPPVPSSTSSLTTLINTVVRNPLVFMRAVIVVFGLLCVLAVYNLDGQEGRYDETRFSSTDKLQTKKHASKSSRNTKFVDEYKYIFASKTGIPSNYSETSAGPILEARSLIKSLKTKLWQQWSVDRFPLFLRTMHVPKLSYDIQVHKFRKAVLEQYRNASFVVAFTGSSITAGHDNYYRESYPSVFEQTFAPIFKALKMRLEVRNAALGNNPCFPYDACIPAHAGKDIDILTWEQSMNCGHDPRPVEAFTRGAMFMHKKPTVVYMLSGTPYWTVADCANVSAKHAGGLSIYEKRALNTSFAALLDSSTIMDKMTFLQPDNTGEDMAFFRTYKGLAPMGQSVMDLLAYKCQGPYGDKFSLKSLGKGSTWHPGPRGHKLRADSFLYPLLFMLDDALLQIQKAAKNGTYSIDKLLQASSFFLARSQPSSMHNSQSYIDPLVCQKEECDSEPQCFTDYEPRVTNALAAKVVGKYSWPTELSFFDKKAIENAKKLNTGQRDFKNIYMSRNHTNALSFAITSSRDNPVWLCELQKGFLQYPSGFGDLDTDADVYLYQNLKFSSSKQRDKFVPNKLAGIPLNLTLVSDQCYKTVPIPKGDHVISIYQKSVKLITIAYLLHW